MYHLGPGDIEGTAMVPPQVLRINAFEVLMSSSKERRLPEEAVGDSLRGDQKMRNMIIDVLCKINIGWSPQSVSSIGDSCVKQVTAAMWYLDPHHDTLRERGLKVPKELEHLNGSNDWRSKKIKKPQLSVEGLDSHIQSLSHLISQPAP